MYDPTTKQYVFDPYAEADYFILSNHPEFGSARVFETIAQPPPTPAISGRSR